MITTTFTVAIVKKHAFKKNLWYNTYQKIEIFGTQSQHSHFGI